MEYNIIEKNNIKMIEVSPINATGVAEGYCSTRHGGISVGTTASMSVNIYKKLDIEAGQENYRIFCKAIGTDSDRVITNRLLYGTDIVRCVDSSDLIDIYDEPLSPHADGLVTNDKNITLFLYAADCAIIQFVDPVKKVIGCCHAGWRGSLCGIIGNTVKAMHDNYGCSENDIIGVVLPSIGKCCFEVGENVYEEFVQAGFAEFCDLSNDKPHIDLYGVNTELLRQAGLKTENIHKIEICTYCHNDMFHSYRKGPVEKRTNSDGKISEVHLNGMNGMFLKLI